MMIGDIPKESHIRNKKIIDSMSFRYPRQIIMAAGNTLPQKHIRKVKKDHDDIPNKIAIVSKIITT